MVEHASSPSSPLTANVAHGEEQELKVKIRVLEARRTDDQQQIRSLKARIDEMETVIAWKPKLMAKLSQLQQENLQTKRELQDQAAELQLAETKLTESSEQLEMSMLDKEVAEERAEAAEQLLDDMKEKLAVAQVELGVLRESGGTASGEVSDGKATLAYVQLERQNERLKEALLR